MQNNFSTFRPEIKDVKVKKVQLIDNIYHVFGGRTDKRSKCCGKKMNIHDYRVVNIKSGSMSSVGIKKFDNIKIL